MIILWHRVTKERLPIRPCHMSMQSACAFDLVLLVYLFFSSVFIWGMFFIRFGLALLILLCVVFELPLLFLLHWLMIILRHHLMTKGVHKNLSYVHVHCLRIWFGLVLPLLLPVCLYMRLWSLLDLVLRFSFCFVLELPMELCIMCVSIGQWFKSGTRMARGCPQT